MAASLIRFHGELMELVPFEDGEVSYQVDRRASIKDVVEALGVPHTEVGAFRVDGAEVGFGHIVQGGSSITVVPLEPPVDVTKPTRLRPKPLDTLRFVVDVNVGKLASLLRLVGLDTAYDPSWGDAFIAELADREGRVVLTRDRLLLKRKSVVWGRLVKAEHPAQQLKEVASFFGLRGPFQPFSRCLRCNVPLQRVDKKDILHRLEPKTKKYFQEFHQCPACDRLYWPGSHHDRMLSWLKLITPRHREKV